MLTPEEIQEIADTMYPLLEDLNNWIIRDLIKRLMARIGRGEKAMLTATDEWQLQVYQEAGGHLQTVRRLLRRFLELSDAEIGRIFEDAGIKALEADNRIYTAARGEKLALSENMVRVMTDVYQRTKGTIHNFTRTTAEESQKKLIRILDLAHWKVSSGAQSYTAAVMDAVNEIADTQTQVVYPSGHVDTIETAVLRAVRTGTAQASGNLSIQGMEEHGWDLIRVSAHLGARYGDGGENPGNHFWWQGKLYSRSGENPDYPPFLKSTGYGTGEGLCGWNCRHSFGPGDPDNNPFQDYNSEENRKAYDLSQRQRKMEREIRKSKTKLAALQEAIDAAEDPAVRSEMEDAYTEAALRLKSQNETYNAFCKDNGLKRYEDRLQAAKWGREQARRSIKTVREVEKPLANPQDSGIISNYTEMFRKKDEAGTTFRPISDRTFYNLTIAARKKGANILRGTEEVERHLDSMNATASTIGDTLLFRKNVCISEVLEETHHFEQNLAGMNDDKEGTLRTILNEIDAKKFIIENAGKYHVPRIEIEHIKRQLKSYQDQLEDYYRRQE